MKNKIQCNDLDNLSLHWLVKFGVKKNMQDIIEIKLKGLKKVLVKENRSEALSKGDQNASLSETMKTSETFFKKANKLIKETCLNTTMHGLPSIVRNELILIKIIWTIVFLSSSGYCAYLIVKMIQNYLEYNYVTNIDTLYERPSIFPTIMVCNMNGYQTSASINYSKQVLAANGLSTNIYLNPLFPDRIAASLMAKYLVGANAYAELYKNNSKENRKLFGLVISKVCLICIICFLL